MGKSKRYAAMLLCSISLLAKPAYAFWPVFDFTEIVPILKQAKTTKETITKIKDSLTKLNETKKAIGNIGTMADFSKSLEELSPSSMLALSDRTTQTNLNTTNLASVMPQVVSQSISTATSKHSENIDKFISQVQKELFKNVSTNEIVISYNDIPFLKFEEEEEEEEVSGQKIKEIDESLHSALKSVLAENKQIAEELNDVLETMLTVLNRAAKVNSASLTELDGAVKETKIMNDEDKNLLRKKIDKLSQKQQNVMDKAAIIIEDIQDNYNQNYEVVIKDGTKNYIKLASAYVNGDESRQTVENAGVKLKQQVAFLNAEQDNKSLAEIENMTQEILTETENLKTEIKEILQKK